MKDSRWLLQQIAKQSRMLFDKTMFVILTTNLFRDVVEVKEDVKCYKISDKVASPTVPGYNRHHPNNKTYNDKDGDNYSGKGIII